MATPHPKMYTVVGYEPTRREGYPYPAFVATFDSFTEAARLTRTRNANARKRQPYPALQRYFTVLYCGDRAIRTER